MDIAPVTAAVTLPKDFNETSLANLAREIAMDIHEPIDVLKRFGLTEEQYERIQQMNLFQQMLKQAKIDWESAASTPDRLKLQAAAGLEKALPSITARMMNSGELLSAQVEAGKLLAKMAGVGERESTSDAGKFAITINLGGDQKITLEKDITPREEAPALPSPGTLLEDAKGPGNT